VLDFDGKTSSLLVKENPHIHLLGAPFSMVLDINPVARSRGCLFRRWEVGCGCGKDGSLILDANAAQNNRLSSQHGLWREKWNRLIADFRRVKLPLFSATEPLVDRKSLSGET